MEMSFTTSLIFLFFSFLGSAILLFFVQRSSRRLPQANYSPLKSYPIVGNIPHLAKNSHRLLEWTSELIPASPTGTVTIAPFVFTADPANIEHISRTRFANYHKSESILSAFRDCLGRGLATSNGEEWRLHRKATTPEFIAGSLRAFFHENLCCGITARLLPLLTIASRRGDVVDLHDVLERFAFDNICRLVFDRDTRCLGGDGSDKEGERFFLAFGEASRLCVERAKLPFALIWRVKKWFGIGTERPLRESMETIYRFVDKCIQSGRDHPAGGRDLLSRFTAEGTNSAEFVRENLVSFVLAGRDTTPAALVWFFWLLSSRPDVVAKIREEVDRIRAGKQRGESHGFTLDELREMNYLQAAISESLRLYPPVPLVPRDCLADDMLPDGAVVRRGWIVMYNSYAMGRREAIWGPDCGEYKPERWLEKGEFRPRSTWVLPVFHGGPRTCLGKEVAYVMMKAVAASILEKFDLDAVAASSKHHLLLAMEMEGGLQVRLKEGRVFSERKLSEDS